MRTRTGALSSLFCLFLVGSLVAVGCHGDGYDSPTSTRAALAPQGALSFSCGVNCSYEGGATNNGDGCAVNVRGVTRLLSSNGAELASDSWALDPTRRVNIGESFLYDDCCFSLTDRSSMGSYRTDIFWDDAPCG